MISAAPRNKSFDGLRGAAALAVFFSHVAALTWNPFLDANSPGFWEWNEWHLGAPAVDIFLVLSGYVLASSLLDRTKGYGIYLSSRIVRLMPIAWAGVILGLIARQIIQTNPFPYGTGGTLKEFLVPLTLSDGVGLFTMIAPVANTHAINPPLWTLPVEMMGSILIPLFLIGAKRMGWYLLLIVALAGFPLSYATGYIAFGLAVPICLGVLVRYNISQIMTPYPAFLALAGCSILFSRHIIGVDHVLWRWITMTGAAMILIGLHQGVAKKFFQSPGMLSLGRISYAFYALHFPILACTVVLLAPKIGITASAFSALPLALLTARFATNFIDRPAINLSRRISEKQK